MWKAEGNQLKRQATPDSQVASSINKGTYIQALFIQNLNGVQSHKLSRWAQHYITLPKLHPWGSSRSGEAKWNHSKVRGRGEGTSNCHGPAHRSRSSHVLSKTSPKEQRTQKLICAERLMPLVPASRNIYLLPQYFIFYLNLWLVHTYHGSKGNFLGNFIFAFYRRYMHKKMLPIIL